ncbi:MAG: glycosyltransferase [Oscillospiraceae bacterium]|nr:glycosyltransferase [Oscillospiraceae bacterium]
MKKIAIVAGQLVVGGVERALISFLQEIDYSKYEVTLWLQNSKEGALLSMIDPRVRIREIEKPIPKQVLISQIKHFQILQVIKAIANRILARIFCKNLIKNLRYSTKCLPLCSKERYDCLIVYQGLARDQIATALYRFCAQKRICWIHGKNTFHESTKRYIQKEYKRFDKIVYVSEATKENFLRDFPAVAEKSSVIYNLIDDRAIVEQSELETKESLNGSAIATVGRLSPEKGQQMIPKAARILLDQGYEIYWYLVGDGSLRAEVEQEIEKYGVQDHVILLGTKMNPYPYIKNCDIYVQPSFTEGWGLTVQEARILEKPIVVTPIPVMEEQIRNGENGLIVEAMTPEAIADGVRQLLDHPALIEKFTKALKNETFDNSAELQKLYDLIES